MWNRSWNAVSRHAPGALACAAALTLLASPAPHAVRAAEFAGVARCFLNGSIRARVLDYASGQPLAHADVTLIGTPFTSVTDKNGALRLRGVPAGTYRARIACRGYHTGVVSVRVVPDRPTVIEFSLLVAEEGPDVQLASTSRKRDQHPAIDS
jgi:hypothetical protein